MERGDTVRCNRQNRVSHARIRREATECLAVRGNRLLLIEAVLILTAQLMLYVTLSNVILLPTFFIKSEAALLGIELCNGIAAYALLVFVTLPTAIGLFYMTNEMVDGKAVALMTLFTAFSQKERYRTVLSLSWGLFWRLWISSFAVGLPFAVKRLFFTENALLTPICVAITVIAIALMLFVLLKHFTLIGRVVRYGEPPHDVRRKIGSFRIWPALCGIRYFIGFLPQILLGLLTFGILWLWDTLPKMLVAYSLIVCQSED